MELKLATTPASAGHTDRRAVQRGSGVSNERSLLTGECATIRMEETE